MTCTYGRPVRASLRDARSPTPHYAVSYGYSDVGRLHSVTSQVAGAAAQTFCYSYLAGSDLVAGLSASNDTDLVMTVEKVYADNLDRLDGVINVGSNDSVVSGFGYQYNDLDQRTRVDRFKPGVYAQYGYDAKDQLISALENFVNPEQPTTHSYAYDDIGNRLSATASGASSQRTDTYRPTRVNQYAQITSLDELGDGQPSDRIPLHDPAGNLTNDSSRVFTWNGENRLVRVEPETPSEGDLKLQFSYDYMGRRFQKIVS